MDEDPHDSGGTYVYAVTHGLTDLYALPDLAVSGAIASVTVSAVARDIPDDACSPPGAARSTSSSG